MKGNILLTIPNFVTAGSQYVLLALYKIYKQQHKTFILVDDAQGNFPETVGPDDRLVLPKKGYLGFWEGIKYAIRFASLLRKHKIGIVHSWDYRSEVWEAIGCRIAGVPYDYTKKNNAWSGKWKLKSLLATRIVYDHPEMLQRFFKTKNLAKKAVFNPHGVDTEIFRPSDALPETKYVIGCIGNIGQNKNQLVILKALTMISVPVHCRFFGNADPKYLESLQDFIRDHQLSSKVSISGFVENHNLPEILHGMDLLILASYNEGLPVILLEAMACGVYCIASNSGGGSEFLISSCGCGDLFDPDDAGKLANLIETYYADPGSKRVNIPYAITETEKKFSVHREGRKYLELFESL